MNISLNDRIKLNKNRLLNTDDTYSNLYKKDASMAWPGDFVGRYLLALSSLYEALDDAKEKEEVLLALNKLFKEKDGKTNQYYYFGETYNPERINEQQLSGNGWYIRSLVAYYRLTKDEKYLNELKVITENFLLKVAPHYEKYPVKRDFLGGAVSGHMAEKTNNGFLLSSDVGCAFILLDGFVDVYSVLKTDDLRHAICNIIKIFENIDYLALRCQTHATLTCSRAILRFYQMVNDKHYLDLVISIFENYQKYGMTLEYENMNWFYRTDSWTEPCCVIDSFILSHDLYLITKENKYLELFNRIATNGIRISQRYNGGAGCSTILHEKNSVLKCSIFEAWFCCSMRLGEGMKYLSSSRLIKENENSYLMMLPANVNKDGINIDIDYYYKNNLTVTCEKDAKVGIYLPSKTVIKSCNCDYSVNGNLLSLNVKKGVKVIVEYELSVNENNGVYFLGDMLLTLKEKHTEKLFSINGKDYSYVLSSAEYKEKELEAIEQRL